MSAANLSSGPERTPGQGDLLPESDEDIGFTRLDRAIVWLGKKLSLVFAYKDLMIPSAKPILGT